MFSLFSKDKSFGVDVGTQSVKIVELEKDDDQIQLANYAIWSNDVGEVIQEQGENTMSASQISDIIQKMASEADMDMDKVYFALPSFFTFSSVMTVPEMSEEELSETVPLQARKHVPVPIEEVQINWINLGKHARENKLNVLIIAIPNNVVAKYQNIADNLDVDIQGFELDIFSRLRSLNLPAKHTCIVDIGSRSTSVSMVDAEENLRMIRAFDVGGNHITRRLANALEVSMERAELMKIDNGLSGDPGVASVIETVLEKFFRKEVGEMVEEYTDMMNTTIERIELAGGISQMKGLNEFVKQTMGKISSQETIEVQEAKPTQNVEVPDQLSEIFYKEVWQDVSLAIGIALSKYDEV